MSHDHAFDLSRRGQLDQERHHEKVRKAIKDNLGDLIADASVQGPDGKVKVRIKEFREHRFRYADGEGEGIGSGRPGTKKGDVLGKTDQQGQGSGKGQAGDQHEEGTYEVWVSADAVAAELFADLELPNIKPKAKTTVTEPDPVFKDIRRKGPMGLLDLRHTIKSNLINNAIKGKPGFHHITDDDLRFKALETEQVTKDQCVVIFIRDRSGSMGEFEKEMTRLGAFWTLTFLRQRYGEQVKPVYILHDTAAEEVDEERFFHQSESGGTRISASYELTKRLIETEYPPARWNVYAMQFSDGDNLVSDNPISIDLLQEIAPHLNLLAYWEIDATTGGPSYYRTATFGNLLAKELPHVKAVETFTVKDKADIAAAIRHFFRKRGQPA